MQDAAQGRVASDVGANTGIRQVAVQVDAAAHMVGHDHCENDGGRFHEGHGGSHVSAKRHALVVQVLGSRDEGHSTHRAIGCGNGCGVKTGQKPAQHTIANQGHDASHAKRGSQTDDHITGQARLRECKAALEAQRHQQIQ